MVKMMDILVLLLHLVHLLLDREMYIYRDHILGLPVLGSIGVNGQRAAPIVLPSSVRRLYVEAALR